MQLLDPHNGNQKLLLDFLICRPQFFFANKDVIKPRIIFTIFWKFNLLKSIWKILWILPTIDLNLPIASLAVAIAETITLIVLVIFCRPAFILPIMAPTAPLTAVAIPSYTFCTIIFDNDLANAAVLLNAEDIRPNICAASNLQNIVKSDDATSIKVVIIPVGITLLSNDFSFPITASITFAITSFIQDIMPEIPLAIARLIPFIALFNILLSTFLPVIIEIILPAGSRANDDARLPASLNILSKSVSNPAPAGPAAPSAIPKMSVGISIGFVA